MATMVKPALYKIQGVNTSWSWAQLKDLAFIVGETSKYVWETFFELTSDGYMMPIAFDCWGAGTIWYVNHQGKMVQGLGTGQFALGGQEAFQQVVEDGRLYVPAGWAMKVVKVHESAVAHHEQHYGKTQPRWSAGWSTQFRHNALLLYSLDEVTYENARDFARECGAWFQAEGTKGLLVQFPGRPIEYYTWAAFKRTLKTPSKK